MLLIPRRRLLPLALVGMGISLIVGVFVVVVVAMSWFSNPPFGLGNAPPQPVAFPHTVHAGQPPNGMGIQCEFCHRNVAKGDAATVPSLEQCVFCHKLINKGNVVAGATSANLNEVQKVVDSAAANQPIDWERVHRLPDHVRFVHESHIRYFTQEGTKTLINGETETRALAVDEVCSICHGEVAKMDVVKPKRFQSLKMGTCLDCHRENNVPTDCTICHK